MNVCLYKNTYFTDFFLETVCYIIQAGLRLHYVAEDE